MRIDPDSKIGVALAVLRKIKLAPKDVHVQTYSNCREQGFFITSYMQRDMNYRRCVSFAEHRACDDIIVQFGTHKDFDDYGVLVEEKYPRNVKHFAKGEHERAAIFATKWLKGKK